MPTEGKVWRHVIISSVNSWFPGDPRGFRSRKHRIHSSGDYRNPPPDGEHAGLLRHNKDRGGKLVIIPKRARCDAGRSIVGKLEQLGHRVLAVSVGGVHAHLLVELPDNRAGMGDIAGRLKQASSHAIRETLPGRVWGCGGSFTRIADRQHHRNVYRYILTEQKPGTWTWSFRDGEAWIT